ncbi:hypothetical protein BDV93DRAFT_520769 [Ceratobasidium sp. AG-I]|nr:hypothetical protein BDV93DRAFT_520769 [Ceratobasidium sp. AG-I]
MDFCCIAIGCPTKIDADGSDNGQTRLCPRCNNVSVFGAKKRTWIEICFVPLIPMKSSRIWNCSICQWHVDQDQPNGYAPPLPGPPQGGPSPYYQPNYGPPPGQQQWGPPPNSYQGGPGGGQPGYYQQPSYGPGR